MLFSTTWSVAPGGSGSVPSWGAERRAPCAEVVAAPCQVASPMPTSASRTNSAREVALLCLYILPVLSGRLLHTHVAQPPGLPLGRDQRVVDDLADLSPRRGVAG